MRHTVVLEREADGGYVAAVPALPGCVSQRDSRTETLADIREAIELCRADDAARADEVLVRTGTIRFTAGMFYAHSTPDASKSDWQPLCDHLLKTAALAEQFGARIKIARAARLAGLLHDLGKYTPEFQARLTGARERVDHSTAGAAIVSQLATGNDRVVAELIAYAIAGHHAGLPDRRGASSSTLDQRLADFANAAPLAAVWQQEIDPDANGLLPSFDWRTDDKARFAFQVALLGRMIFSCLVDADFKDTEQFYAQAAGYVPDRDWPMLQSVLPDFIRAFDEHMRRKRSDATAVNRLRAAILDAVRAEATKARGLFTLTVPTGGGKTLASLGFALDHARAHGHDRIIYAIPFTAIIDQTAQTFRDILGEDLVLEHHSAIDDDEARQTVEARDKLKLAMEDWAAPIVVTTNVQLFESLFAARTSRSRKLHNIANSVIILDEAQTLPRRLLAPCAQALDELARNYGCSIILCTATQPALDADNFKPGHPVGLSLAGRELAPDPAQLARTLQRVRLIHGVEMDDAALVAALAEASQGLVIVNSRKHALALYRAAQQAGLDGLVHLTTRQYAAHRRVILDDVRTRLAQGAPCRLIATSLVEAGVDLDFPRVWRAEAGLDQIAQAAGRCNREGRRPLDDSIVTVFRAPSDPPPADIKALADDMRRVAGKHDNLLSPAAMDEYFAEVYWRVDKDVDAEKILYDFSVGSGGTDFSYRTVAQKFRMIESGMTPVIVAADDRARRAIAKLAIERIPSGAIARDLQPYIVQVPPRARLRLIDCGHAAFERQKLRGDQFVVLSTNSLYREEVGLLWEDGEYLAVESQII